MSITWKEVHRTAWNINAEAMAIADVCFGEDCHYRDGLPARLEIEPWLTRMRNHLNALDRATSDADVEAKRQTALETMEMDE